MVKNYFRNILLITVYFFTFSVFCQELPPIDVFYTEDYSAENQNWNISQCEKGFLYVANNKGLLEFNGASWRLYETPNETIMRSVKAFKGKVFTGFYMGFGYWEMNDFGNLEYSSIVKNQKVQMLEDEQIWSIVELDGWMLFKSLERIYLYNLETKSIKIIESEFKINTLAKVDDVIYFQEDRKGFFKIENGVPKLVSDHKIIKDNFIVDVFQKENKLLFLTQKNGFFYLEGDKPIKWKTPSDNLFIDKTIYSVKQLKDKSFAIGTISNGLIYLNNKGELNYQINQTTGLSNNTVLFVFEDKMNNIWLGLDNGINCINNKSHFKTYNIKSDYLGTIYASIVFEDNIYIGTNQGLFYRNINSKKPFQFILNTQGQVWGLENIDNKLFCGHDSGTFIIDNFKAKNIFKDKGTWTLIKINKDTILQGSYDGIYVLKKEGVQWKVKNKIKGFNNSSKFIVQLDKNTFFVNHEYKGVFKLTLGEAFTEVVELKKEKSVLKGVHSSIIKYQDKILYSNKKGVYVYNNKTSNFKRDSLYSDLISEESFISAKLVHNSSSNKLWSFSKDYIKYVSPGKLSNKPEINKIFISKTIPKAVSGYENILHLSNEEYLIGTSKGYLLVDLKEHSEIPNFNIYLNKIQSFVTDEPRQNLSLTKERKLDFKNNNLEFFFSSPNFNKTLSTKYQYKLQGFNKSWSVPSESNSILFENISYGSYTLIVRAIVGDKLSSNEVVYKFEIDRPWYLSNAFVLIYVLLFLFAFYSVHIASKRYYKKQREDLLDKAKKESELKELESKQVIIKLNNEKLRNDIESKNRELASSTMNIIKKNDFLNTIKKELIDGGQKSIFKVVKIIDKDLNNTDDWKMFQEAFNNADKKFLKKVKDLHPSLTPNDLRLCAYLRLNLSSKEIAPLLNISPRSVEVKRYRLRKKMDLPHDSNLTNYILEI